MNDRAIDWDGFHNARDLGGLRVRGGGRTRPGSLIRSGNIRFVTEAGWVAARAAGYRTVLDLRNDDEVRPLPALDAAGLQRVRVPIDGVEDTVLWRYLTDELLDGTPLYFRPFLERKPERCVAALTALADAPDGGVIFHCGAGRDRTGLVSLMVLALSDVEPEEIAADYALSGDRLPALYAALGTAGDLAEVEAALAARGTTVRAAVLECLAGLPELGGLEAYLVGAGLTPARVEALRARLR